MSTSGWQPEAYHDVQGLCRHILLEILFMQRHGLSLEDVVTLMCNNNCGMRKPDFKSYNALVCSYAEERLGMQVDEMMLPCQACLCERRLNE